MVGNCAIAALIDRRGRIVWHCRPRPDGDPVFCSLLGGDEPETGFSAVELKGLSGSHQEYLGNSALLRTTLTAQDGAAVSITDFAPRFRRFDRIYRPPVLVRRIEPIAGLPHVRVRIRPRFDHGRLAPQVSLGSHHIRYVGEGGALRMTTDGPVAHFAAETSFALTSPVTLVIGPDENVTLPLHRLGREFADRTHDFWIDWSRSLSIPFEWQEVVIRAAITLKLCSFEDTGAILAALTTSIPEAPDSARTWDYRFCWLRDAWFVVQAFNRLGATQTMTGLLEYVLCVCGTVDVAGLQPVYGLLPETPLTEVELVTLPGYRGMGPVRIGNLAYQQRQNDTYGSVILALAQMFFDHRLPRRGDLQLFRQLERFGDVAAAVALEEDAGLWEYRGRNAVHTYSAAMCWAACDRLAKIAEVLDQSERAEHWRKEAERLRAVLLERAWNSERASFTSHLGGQDLDASLLLLQEIGLVAASDPRFVATVDAVGQDLRRGDLLLRYSTADDFGVPHTAFLVCTLWYVDALAALGRRDEARALFERVLACRNHLGLLSEDFDLATGELWGNFPQTYSMVGLVHSAMRLSKSWEEAFWRGW